MADFMPDKCTDTTLLKVCLSEIYLENNENYDLLNTWNFYIKIQMKTSTVLVTLSTEEYSW